MLPKLLKGAFVGIKFLIKVPWRKISKEGSEAVAAVKAVKIDGVNDRQEIVNALEQCIDVVDLVFPNFKAVYELVHKKNPEVKSK